MGEGLLLELSDAFAGEAELSADSVQRLRVMAVEPEAEREHPPHPGRKLCERVLEIRSLQLLDCGVIGLFA